MSCTAVKDGDSYILNGTKSWVTSGLEGKAAVIFATIDKSLKHKGKYKLTHFVKSNSFIFTNDYLFFSIFVKVNFSSYSIMNC